MTRILAVSNDASLLRTRQMLLECQGYDVVSAVGLPQSLNECKRGNFDLLVLGHAIPEEDKVAVIACFRQHNQAPVIALRLPNQGPVHGADFDVSTEPQDLLNSVAEALAGRRAVKKRSTKNIESGEWSPRADENPAIASELWRGISRS